MKTSRKHELKGAFKAIVAIAVLGLMIGVGVATTLMSDDGFFVDGNEVLVEGDFTTWTHKWTMDIDGGVYTRNRCSFWVNERDETVYLIWHDDSQDSRVGIYNLADNSTVFESSDGSDYFGGVPFFSAAGEPGISYFASDIMDGTVISQSSYMLLLRADYDTLEVWRGGATAIWSHNTSVEVGASDDIYGGLISPSGKYILIRPWTGETLLCYEGS